jgi:hypothetical protein
MTPEQLKLYREMIKSGKSDVDKLYETAAATFVILTCIILGLLLCVILTKSW